MRVEIQRETERERKLFPYCNLLYRTSKNERERARLDKRDPLIVEEWRTEVGGTLEQGTLLASD